MCSTSGSAVLFPDNRVTKTAAQARKCDTIPYGGIVRKGVRRMGHVAREKTKLLNRVKRMRGQLEAIERALDADDECATVLQQATACRGALDGFIAEVIEDHIREHVVDPSAQQDDPRRKAAEEL